MIDQPNFVQISIVMPTFNRSNTIGLAIESVQNQNFKNWELIIIDNESTDQTADVVKKYSDYDGRIKYYYINKSIYPGIAEYLNKGIQVARGKYIARLDDDDEWCDNEKLNKQFNYLENHPDVILIGGGAIMINEKRKSLYKFLKRETDNQIRNNALYANPFWHNTVMFRKNKAYDVGLYRNLRFVEDWDLWLRLGAIGKFYNFQEHFSLYMNAGQNISVSNQRLASKMILKLIKEYKKEYPNYNKAFILNFLQYLFSLLPKVFKKRVQNFLFYIKRNFF